MTDLETHPIPNGFIPKSTTILVIGTFPPRKEYIEKKEGFFFYASEKNHFWNRFDNLFPGQNGLKKTKSKNSQETFVENRKRKEDFCESRELGLIDVFTNIRRKKEGSYLDIEIIQEEGGNIIQNKILEKVLRECNIRRICCTYLLAYETLLKEIGILGWPIEKVSDNSTANGEKSLVSVFGKTFELLLLYPATRSRHTGTLKDAQYQKFLFDC